MATEGSVYQRKDGRWVAQYRDAKDKVRYLYRKTKAEAKKARREALQDRDEGFVPADKLTVGLYLDEWMDERRNTVSARTWRVQESMIGNRVQPGIGDYRLCKLAGKDVRQMYRRLIKEGLSPSTVGRVHAILKQALRDAVREKRIRTNPLDDVKAPKQSHKDKYVLTPEEVRRLLDAVRGDRFEGVYVLGATCGLRIGEVLALRFEDIDLDRGTIRIERTLHNGECTAPKTHSSRRTLTLPQRALEALVRLSITLFSDYVYRKMGQSRAEALEYLRSLPCPPSMIVDSGGGLQVYWLLSVPVTSTEDKAFAEKIMSAMCKWWQTDKVKDYSRVLRVPGTLHVKPEYETPRECFIEQPDNGARYSLDELWGMVPEEYHTPQKSVSPGPNGSHPPKEGRPLDPPDLPLGVGDGRHLKATRVIGYFASLKTKGGWPLPVDEVRRNPEMWFENPNNCSTPLHLSDDPKEIKEWVVDDLIPDDYPSTWYGAGGGQHQHHHACRRNQYRYSLNNRFLPFLRYLTLLWDVTPAGTQGPLAITQGHVVTVYGLYLVEAPPAVYVIEAVGVAGVDKVVSSTSVDLISALAGVDPIGATSPVDNIVPTQAIEAIIPGSSIKVVVPLCAREFIIAAGADEVRRQGYPASQDQRGCHHHQQDR